MKIEIESQTASPDQGSGAGDTLPVGETPRSEYGVHGFRDLPEDQRTAILSDYMDALEKGWAIPEAQAIAREKHATRIFTTQPMTDLHNQGTESHYTNDDYANRQEPHEETSAPARRGSLAMFALIVGAVAVLAGFAYFRPSPSPLDQAFDAREDAARAYYAAQGDAIRTQAVADKAKTVRDAAKARYEAAYKREACILAGNCK